MLLFVGFCLPGEFVRAGNPDDFQRLDEAYRQFVEQTGRSQNPLPFVVHARTEGAQVTAHTGFFLKDIRYDRFQATISSPKRWCEVMLLHLNVKSCISREERESDIVDLYLGRKVYQSPVDAVHVELKFEDESSERVSRIFLTAESGPFGTSSYIQAGGHTRG